MFEPALTAILEAGYTARFVARGDSMYPTIHDGDAVHVEPCTQHSLRVGEVVLAQASRGLTAHRIVRIRERHGAVQVVTRGDNCLRSDPPLLSVAILGRVVSVERNSLKKRLFDDTLTLFRLSKSTVTYWKAIVRRLR
jgi:signal peptidase I